MNLCIHYSHIKTTEGILYIEAIVYKETPRRLSMYERLPENAQDLLYIKNLQNVFEI